MEVKPMSIKKFLPFLVAVLLVAILTIPGCDELITESYTIIQVDSTLGAKCTDCHDDDDIRILRPSRQWPNSAHSSDRLLDRDVDLNGTLKNATDCGPRCHTHEGFVDWVDNGASAATSYTSANSMVCYTCHTPHTGPYGTWDDKGLRGVGSDSLPIVTFLEGSVVYNAGKSNMCAICHQATDIAPQTSGNRAIDPLWGPHFSPQADAFRGTSGYLADDTPDLSNPHAAVKDGCIGCHYGTGQRYEFGQHTFRLSDPDNGEEFYLNCDGSGCHTGGKSLDSLHSYYTGEHDSLIIYGDSLEVLLKTWGILDPDDPTGRRFNIDEDLDGEMSQILYNYLFYRMDGSQGVHNPPYIYELVSTSLETFASKPPRADFSVSDTVICNGDSVYFYDNSSSMVGIADWCWYYNSDDTTCQDSAPNPVHVFELPGVYTVSLEVTDGNASHLTAYPVPITVLGPQAAISVDSIAHVYNSADLDTIVGFAPLDVLFSDASECVGPLTSWQWDFGDGTIITNYNPIRHVFETPGLFSVTLTLMDPYRPEMVYKATKYILAQGPQAAFSVNRPFGFSPHLVQFTDESVSGSSITSWVWDFGVTASDTAIVDDTSSLQNPTYEYKYPGEYDVTLTVTSDLGSNTFVKSKAIRIFHPSASFSWVADRGCAPFVCSLYNRSIDLANVDTVAWYFGDGDSTIQTDSTVVWYFADGDSTLQTDGGAFYDAVIHTYDTADVFDVTLQLRGAWGRDDKRYSSLIQSLGPDPGFTITTDEYCVDAEITFVSDTDGCGADSHQWIFGDDTASTEVNPLYSFSDTGAFVVEHIVTNDYGSQADTQSIEITGPSARFTVEDGVIEGCNPMTVTFVNESPCPIDEWYWYFDDGAVDTTVVNTVTHTYTVVKHYRPSLEVSVGGIVKDSLPLNEDELVNVISVTAGFDVDNRIVCPDSVVQFTDTSKCDVVYYRWTFGDSDSTESTDQNPTHAYDTAGQFEVTQTVFDADSTHSQSVRDTITVLDGLPVPDFEVLPPTSGLFLKITDSSVNAVTWFWQLFDADNIVLRTYSNPLFPTSPTLDVPGPGTYRVVLTVTNQCGHQSLEKTVVVPE